MVAASPTRTLSRTGLYRVGSNGGHPELLAANGGLPSPSPDGSRLAFISLEDENAAQIRVLDLGNKSSVDLGTATFGTSPQWSRRGDQIVYGVQGAVGKIDPTTARRFTLVNEPLPANFSPSPDGDRVAFAGVGGLHIASETGDVLAFRAAGGLQVTTEVKWSRDGTKLAFVVTHGGLTPELWTMDSDGSNVRMLMHGAMESIAGIDFSPDNSQLIFARTPTGSSTANASDIWRIGADGSKLVAVTRNRLEESAPKYSPDGREIAFLRDGDLWVVTPGTSGPPVTLPAAGPLQAPPPAISQPSAPAVQLTPPATIRVYHDPNNNCRANEITGQIDTIDFETYVKHVVPSEVYSTWTAEALKTQAVAARSYSWFWVLQHTGQTWDVKDWTNYQVMCDVTAQSTNLAVDATRGQYGDYGGDVIFAAYGADNGDPTSTNSWGNPYLIAVDDPPAFGDSVAGNGIGMSQWGAYYWASSPYNWNYQQILMHYYSGVTIESSAGSSPDTTSPIAGMVMPWSQWGATSNRLFLSGSASDNSSSIALVSFIAKYFDGSTNQTTSLAPTYDGNYWDYLADLTTIPDQSGITVTPKVSDASGNSFSGNGVTFTLDRVPPTGILSAPGTTTGQTVTLTLNASDSGPGGLAQMAFSNNWIWQGENQSFSNGSGSVVADSSALDGKALAGRVGTNPAGLWYGPDTTVLALGQPYRAYFRLKTDNVATANEIAMLDVTDYGGVSTFGLKRLRGSDFRAANTYQEFYVDFLPPGYATQGLEFRVSYRAAANLWLDRIIVVSYPTSYSSSAQWTLPPGNGPKTVQAKFIDGVGNISPDATAVIWVGPTPTAKTTATPSRTPTVTLTRTPTPILTPEIWLPFITH